jgi:hypothetical protein
MKKIAIVVGLLLLGGLAVVSVIVQVEADYTLRALGGEGKARALVLFHPSRDARFSDDLAIALSEGFKAAGFAVDLATLTEETPGDPRGYALIGVVSNTYYWTPDLPTLRYLERAQLQGISAVGAIGGAGSTARSQRILDEALRRSGAIVIGTRSFWLWRPNDERRMSESNRDVALQQARQFGMDTANTVLAVRPGKP